MKATEAPVLFETLSQSETPFSLRASEQIPPCDVEWRWQLVDAAGRATNAATVNCKTSQSKLHGAMWMIPTIDSDREFVTTDVAETIVLMAVEAPLDNAISVFTPPLMLAASELQPGETFASRSDMRVDWLDGRGERDRGIGERTATIVGGSRVRTPLGEFIVTRVQTRFDAKLRFAKVERTTILWIAAGIGPIVEEWRERVTVMGVPISSGNGIAIRISPISRAQDTTRP